MTEENPAFELWLEDLIFNTVKYAPVVLTGPELMGMLMAVHKRGMEDGARLVRNQVPVEDVKLP